MKENEKQLNHNTTRFDSAVMCSNDWNSEWLDNKGTSEQTNGLSWDDAIGFWAVLNVRSIVVVDVWKGGRIPHSQRASVLRFFLPPLPW
jgi:hypothetical protein